TLLVYFFNGPGNPRDLHRLIRRQRQTSIRDSPTTEPVAAPPTPAPVDPYMLGLRDAVLSGWFNQETDELFSGFPISAEDTVLD
ncbi:hypothetical protein Q2427_25165, partial [Escherichia coli]|nr:hypothetical protein [Escherichia coli]